MRSPSWGTAWCRIAREICESIHRFGETEGQLLMLLTFLIFGLTMVPAARGELDWRVALYVAASLTLVRMVPVALALVGSGLRLPSVAFLGWFGPRGIASIAFLLLLSDAPHNGLIRAVGVATVAASVVLHGLTARPLASVYGAMCDESLRETPEAPEHEEVDELPLRAEPD